MFEAQQDAAASDFLQQQGWADGAADDAVPSRSGRDRYGLPAHSRMTSEQVQGLQKQCRETVSKMRSHVDAWICSASTVYILHVYTHTCMLIHMRALLSLHTLCCSAVHGADLAQVVCRRYIIQYPMCTQLLWAIRRISCSST